MAFVKLSLASRSNSDYSRIRGAGLPPVIPKHGQDAHATFMPHPTLIAPRHFDCR